MYNILIIKKIYKKIKQNTYKRNICKINIQPTVFYWLAGEYFRKAFSMVNGAHKPLKAPIPGFLLIEITLILSLIAFTQRDNWQYYYAIILY